MQTTKKVINFRWERYKHLLRNIVTEIKKFFINIFSSNKKQSASKGGRGNINSKGKKVRKFK